MKNLSTLLVGMTGAGKSTIVRVLLNYSARAIICDDQMEYGDVPGAVVAYEVDQAMQLFLSMRWKPFKLVCQFEEPDDYLKIMELAEHTQKVEAHGPLVIVWEEASTHSDTHHIPDIIATLYKKGRHRRISMLTIIQSDTDIHRITRKNSPVIVSLKQTELSGNMRAKFREDEVKALVSLRDEWTPEPVQGRHFLVYPEGTDLYDIWWQYHGYIVKKPRSAPAGNNPPGQTEMEAQRN
jgi:hypothetical protein